MNRAHITMSSATTAADAPMLNMLSSPFSSSGQKEGNKNVVYISGNHTPSTKPVLYERVTLPSGNESSIVH